ncbi:Hydantoinase/oxoprolinase-domain-containing protein [Mycena albidolilacea]|uniref:Hydantoinase/oxoprolinase-domain-containing protein n=1 Tax=Mycena albidolilacea TaxID=1033008 RepID=A0AAD6ZRJ5_9AGAR|nr:Hydantoinase/oxoprolinase-domain-containing protein [Mycena albidolilacea]
MSESPWKLGIDVGGTFTDGILYNSATGESYRSKVLSTPENQAQGVLVAITQLRSLVPAGMTPNLSLHHGTTVATNALLEGTGARVALIVTQGYRDILVMRRSQVPGGLGNWVVHPKAQPLASLELTVEAPGRIGIDGSEVRSFDDGIFRQRIQALKNKGVEAITVSFINSFANNLHEVAASQILQEEFPDLPISLSSTILPELMEYERTLTTVVSAMVRPKVEKYLNSLQSDLKDMDIRILRSDGGLTSPYLAKEYSCNLLYSGPAGGVAGVAGIIAQKTSYKNLLTFDMGGTSTDVCLIQNGIPSLRRETTVGDLTLRAPSVDVRTVGAGGGSVAYVPEVTKALRVGPESAGAVPGPAAYSRGGIKATVTDANAVLGYLPPAGLLGGTFKLDFEASERAVQVIADGVGLTLYEAAEGILKVANEKMYGALKSVSVERGHDPREYSLVAFGGAGPLHACSLARLCQSYPAIIPPSPGVLCAFGDAITSLRHEVGRTYICKLGEVTASDIIDACRSLASQASQVLETQGVVTNQQRHTFEADMRYSGQALNLPVGFALEALEQDGLDVLERSFTALHHSLFTYSLDLRVEVINLRSRAEEVSEDVILKELTKSETDGVPCSDALTGRTQIYWNGTTYTEVPIWERTGLRDGDHIAGPAIITEMDSNTIVMPDHRAEVDRFGNILLWPTDSASVPAEAENNQKIITELVEAALANARLEMDALILRSALSPAMREQLDYFPMISAGSGPNDGKMVVGQFGSYIQHFLKVWKGTIEEGDVFLTNDPYDVQGGISHLNDMLVMLPVYHNGKRVAWTANQGHFTDVGGQTPGSLPINGRTIFEDGIQIPLSKLYDGGKLNEALVNIICRNSRTPDFSRADLHALVAACRIAGQRVSEMCIRFGTDAFETALDDLLDRNKVAFAQLLKTNIPARRMTFSDWMDDDGTGMGPWKVSCTMFKEPLEDGSGERLVYDFDGTDPQAESSVNWLVSPTTWKMRSSAYLIKALDPSITLNDGAYDLMDVRIPRGTLLNPIRPAALSCRTHLLGRTLDLILGLIGQRQPRFMTAAGFSDSPHFFYSGWRADSSYFQLYQIGFGGVPGRPVGDGLDGHSMFPSMKTVPNEYLELYFPLRVEHYATIPDSGGAGLHRGGNGVRIDYCFLRAGEISLHDDRWLTKPWGVNGGDPGARSSKTLVRASDNARVALPSKGDFIKVYEGDVLEWCTWGGGGYGAPYARPAEIVAREVREGLVSRDGALRYGVVLTQALEVEADATATLRAEMVAQKAAKGAEEGAFEINRGGTLAELFERCEEETGLPPPRLPSGRTLSGPAAGLEHIVALHARRQQEDREEFGDNYERYAGLSGGAEVGARGGEGARRCC